MSPIATAASLKRPDRLELLEVFTLWGFAVAQPLYALLSRHGGFLVAHHAGPVDLIWLVAGLSFIPPAVLVAVELLMRRWMPRAALAIHVTLVGGLVAAVLLGALVELMRSPGWAIMGAVFVLAGAATVAYRRTRAARLFLAMLSPATVAFPVVFLAHGTGAKLLWRQFNTAARREAIAARDPVVMIVLDELPLVSLLDENRRINRRRYPNFAALADRATFFRNASGVHQQTEYALPAILTGLRPDRSRIPNAADYPFSLFTLLGGSYELRASEAFTQLCPPRDNREPAATQPSLAARMRSLMTDLTIVYLHVLLPPDLRAGLPAVTQTWRDFAGPSMRELIQHAREGANTRRAQFEHFTRSIEASDSPRFYFLHVLLPHIPWVYTRTGQLYLPENMLYLPGFDLKQERWSTNAWFVEQGDQRHLMQLAMVDRLLGRLLDRLREQGLYDRALIVVTADHGASFWPGASRRDPAATEHPEDILCVPLLIKAPGQREAALTDRNVETIDILPTVADLLGIELPWPVDGQSAIDDSLTPRPNKQMMNRAGKVLRFDARLPRKYEALRHKLKLFGSGEHPNDLFRIGPRRELIGKRLDEVAVAAPLDLEVHLQENLAAWQKSYGSRFIPAMLAGTLDASTGELPADPQMAIALDGTIRAVVPCFPEGHDSLGLSAVVPTSGFRQGANELSILSVEEQSGEVRLRPLRVVPSVLMIPPARPRE